MVKMYYDFCVTTLSKCCIIEIKRIKWECMCFIWGFERMQKSKGELEMKKMLKQPMLWVAAGCLVFAIVFAITGKALHPSNALVNKVEKSINKKNVEKLQECLSPELGTGYAAEFITYSSSLWQIGYGTNEKITMTFLYDEEVEMDEEGYSSLPSSVIVRAGDNVLDVWTTDLLFQEINGKKYLCNLDY